MIYPIIKPFIRFALSIFCPQILLKGITLNRVKGPVLITANHPNSFLDAIIIAAVINRPIHFLARGDAFHKPWHNYVLRTMHMFPVYRLSEGKENLGLNAAAFENSRKVLQKNGVVLIFIEGICVNKHELQPFKKGAARIASSCWKEWIPVQVLPLGIAYNSLHGIGKSVLIKTGQLLNQTELMPYEEEAKNYVRFNQILFQKIETLIEQPRFIPNKSLLGHFLGQLGTIINRPLFKLISRIVDQKTKGTVFYDSVLFGCLFFCYPLYLLIIGVLLTLLYPSFFLIFGILILFPVLAYFATNTKTIL